jgi:AcrR family transcriptional regulator
MSPRVADPDRRNKIVAAATQVLVEKGLRGTTIDAVAAAAGVGKGTVYLYFSSKDELVAGVRAKYLDDYEAALQPPEDSSPFEALRALAHGLLRFSGRNQALHHVLFHEAGFSEHDAFMAFRERVDHLLHQMGAAHHPVTASFVVHGLHGVLIDQAHATKPLPRSVVDAGVDSVLERLAVGMF